MEPPLINSKDCLFFPFEIDFLERIISKIDYAFVWIMAFQMKMRSLAWMADLRGSEMLFPGWKQTKYVFRRWRKPNLLSNVKPLWEAFRLIRNIYVQNGQSCAPRASFSSYFFFVVSCSMCHHECGSSVTSHQNEVRRFICFFFFFFDGLSALHTLLHYEWSLVTVQCS